MGLVAFRLYRLSHYPDYFWHNILFFKNMKFVIYARKSTESEDRQALSIQSQIIEMKEIAKRDHIQIVDILQESKTAKKPGRPIFNEMIKRFEKGKYDGILCWKIDRLARNPVDEGTIKWMLQNSTIKQIKTFDRDYNPEDNVVIASIEFSMASQYIRDLSRNVKRGQAEKIRRGEYPATPPIGYLLDYKTKKIFIDDERWQFVKDAFKLYATHEYSLPKLADKLFADGFRSRNGKKVWANQIYNILKNPIYYGWFRWKEQIYKGIHAPIVSKALFDEVQETFKPKQHIVERNIHNFLFRGHLICGECGLGITAELRNKKKYNKKYTYYRCTKSRGTDKCSQKYLREEELIKEIDKQLAKLKINEDILDLMIGASKAESRREWNDARGVQKKYQELLNSNKLRQDSLIEKFIDDAIPKDIYNKKLAELRNEEATLENNLSESKENFHNVYDVIERAATFTQNAKKIFSEGDPETKKEVLSIISSDITIKDRKIVSFRLAQPFNWIVESAKIEQGGIGSIRTRDFALLETEKATSGVALSRMHGIEESNLCQRFWRPPYYHYTNPACHATRGISNFKFQISNQILMTKF